MNIDLHDADRPCFSRFFLGCAAEGYERNYFQPEGLPFFENSATNIVFVTPKLRWSVPETFRAGG
jgi:hypothetical protein